MSSLELHQVRWLYLDMNSFFASVEQELNPALRGVPVAVVPMHADTTSCIAVSYEGKAFGVKTGTKVGEAKKLCPQMQFVDGDHANYIRYHKRIVEVVESCIPVERVCSIDEVACRLTGSQREVEVAHLLALTIKSAIREQVGQTLRCSIGLGPNRYLSKIAADMRKPDGLTVLRLCDLPQGLFGLKLRDLPGVGPQTEQRLSRQRIWSLQQLVEFSELELQQVWGSTFGRDLWHLLKGEELPSDQQRPQKSLSHSHILPPELRHELGALQVLKKLTAKVALRLRQDHLFASSFQIWVRFLGQADWKARSKIVETQDTLDFIQELGVLWQDLPAGSIYGVGVAVSGLVTEDQHALSLFDNPRRQKLTKVLDKVNEKFGKDLVHFGAIHESEGLAPLRIAFTRIPDESEV